ncbi:MAG: RNA polymerase factor sigma-54 [Candidatus Coatesbacteria bacterium]|nr:RNA polymerase factor sigma-54 [Candidatus Coatesbacteria bacterium]
MADNSLKGHKLSARLDLRLTQKLTLTPQMRQSLEMLQMNVLELQQQLLAELSENPLLEEVMDYERAPDEDVSPDHDPDHDSLDEVMSLLMKRGTDLDPEEDEFRAPVVERWKGDSDVVDPTVYERVLFRRENLTDHLLSQLHFARLSERDFEVAERIIGNIDSDGFLRASVQEIAKNADAKVEDVKQILRLVQEFDPPGVGARDLKECLKIQLRHLFAEHELHTNSDPFPERLRVLVLRAVEKHFDLLVAHKHPELRKALRISETTLKSIVELIETLEPRPGSGFDLDRGIPIVPDVYVVKRGPGFVAMLNEHKLPRLRIVGNYEGNFGADELGQKEREFIRQRAARANWVMKSIAQWKTTLLRVAEVIVKFETEFFQKGALYLKPLKLTDVSAELELHETTVGRTVSNKFIDTPRGLFEMKYFFHRGLDTASGTSVSSITVKQLIKELIDKERCDSPYNDQQISDMLAERRIKISRRAVAKYRESLGIPPSHLRKRQNMT